MAYHEAQVTFFKDATGKELDEAMNKYRDYIGGPTYNVQTDKHGKIHGLSLKKGNVYFRIEERV